MVRISDILWIGLVAVIMSIIVNTTYNYTLEGFTSDTPLSKAKTLLSYLQFEGSENDMILRVNTPGGIRVENGGVKVQNTDESTTDFAKLAGGILLRSVDIPDDTNISEVPKSQGTTWSLMPDKDGVLSESVTYWNPINNDGGYVPIMGHDKNPVDGTFIIPSM